MTEAEIFRNLETTERFLLNIASMMREGVEEVIRETLDQMMPDRDEPKSRQLLRDLEASLEARKNRTEEHSPDTEHTETQRSPEHTGVKTPESSLETFSASTDTHTKAGQINDTHGVIAKQEMTRKKIDTEQTNETLSPADQVDQIKAIVGFMRLSIEAATAFGSMADYEVYGFQLVMDNISERLDNIATFFHTQDNEATKEEQEYGQHNKNHTQER